MNIRQLFNPKYKNRILNKIRELEVQQLKVKMDKSKCIQSTNSTEYAKLWCIQKDIEDDVKLLQSLL
jgi:hypothetical protein